MISPLRSVLFAPGNKAELLQKLPKLSADGVVVDFEDSVPQSEKKTARDNLRELGPLLAQEDFHTFVRTNSISSGLLADDASSLIPGLAGVIIPKIESQKDLKLAAQQLEGTPVEGKMLVGIETVAGLSSAKELLMSSGVIGAYFGAEDYVADLGGVRTEENIEVLFARSQITIAGRLAGIPVLDQIVADFNNIERFRKEALEAKSLGFAGKLCIHPSQVEVANESFSPSSEEVARAKSLLKAYEEAVERGSASVAFDGQMVDEALAKQARMLLARIQ